MAIKPTGTKLRLVNRITVPSIVPRKPLSAEQSAAYSHGPHHRETKVFGHPNSRGEKVD